MVNYRGHDLFSESRALQKGGICTIELVFVSEQETQERLGGDFALHPDLFERRGITYSAVINDNEIQFVTIGIAYLDEPCEATVNSQPIGCEQTIYFAGEFSIYYFIRLVGYLGITADQAQQINARHDQFDSRLETIRMVTFGLVPIGLYFGVDQLGSFLNRRFVPQFQPTKRQESFLQLPWAIGLLLWTLLRVLIELAFS